MRKVRRTRRRVVILALGAIVGLGLGLGSAAAAQEQDGTTTTTTSSTVPVGACPMCPGGGFAGTLPQTSTGFAPPATPGSGLDGLLQAPPDLVDPGLQPTFYERYSVGAYTLDTGPVSRDPASSGMNGMAGSLWAVAVWILDASLKAFQWAFSLDLFSWLGGAVDRIVGALRGPVFDSWVGFALAVAAVWAVWVGFVRRRMLHATEGIAWTVVALVVALVFFAAPKTILDGVNAATTAIPRATLGATAGIIPDPALEDRLGRRETYGNDPADNALRQTGDQLWRTAGYTPWAIMELGSLEVASDVSTDQTVAPGEVPLTYGERLLRAKTFTPAELDRLAAGEVTYDELRAEKLTQLTELRDELARRHPDALPWLNGERAAERVGVAALALVAAALFGGLVLLLAGAVLVAQLGLLVLAAMAPLFLLLGVFPGRGRLVTMRWVELFVSLVIKRVAFGIMLAVVLVLSGSLIASTASLGWGISIALQIGLVVCVFVYRNAFSTLFATTAVPATALAGALGTVSSRSVAAQRRSNEALGRTFVAEWRRSWASAAHRRDKDRPIPVEATTSPHRALGASSGRLRRARRVEATSDGDGHSPRPADPVALAEEPVPAAGAADGNGNGNGSRPPGG